MGRKLKIVIAVHGRFDAFDLARELLRRGHAVTLLTNYPKSIVARFGIASAHVRSLLPHGVAGRALEQLSQLGLSIDADAWLHTWFGRWAAAQIARESWDVVVCWSGIGEETFRALEGRATLKICRRGAAHIRTQARLLLEEEKRTGCPQQQPCSWIIAREEQEYALADVIQVVSTFAYRTFLAEGIPTKKLNINTLAVNTSHFRPSPDVIDQRCTRLLSGEPLRVLNVGTFSFQKGMWDMMEIIRQLGVEDFHFQFVGPVAPETNALVSQLKSFATFTPKQPQNKLPNYYAWGDIFVLPSIQDGFAIVLAQAAAAGLPVLTTDHSGGPDLIDEGKTGWVLPIRTPEAFVERLRWCHTHRSELVEMVRTSYQTNQTRDWSDMARDFEHLCLDYLANPR